MATAARARHTAVFKDRFACCNGLLTRKLEGLLENVSRKTAAEKKYVSNRETRYMGVDLCKKVNDVGRRRSEMKLRANGRT